MRQSRLGPVQIPLGLARRALSTGASGQTGEPGRRPRSCRASPYVDSNSGPHARPFGLGPLAVEGVNLSLATATATATATSTGTLARHRRMHWFLMPVPAASLGRPSIVQVLIETHQGAGARSALTPSTALRARTASCQTIGSVKPRGATADPAHRYEEHGSPLLSQGLGRDGNRSRRLVTAKPRDPYARAGGRQVTARLLPSLTSGPWPGECCLLNGLALALCRKRQGWRLFAT
jgi:hypothetical protein